MDTDQVPFSVADVKPYAVPARLDDLQGSDHGVVTLPRDVAWSGRREYDLDDDYDRAAMYKIVLEEGQEADQRRLLKLAAPAPRLAWPLPGATGPRAVGKPVS